MADHQTMMPPTLASRLRAYVRRLGGAGMAALVLLAAACAVVFVAVPRQELVVDALRAEVGAARERALRVARVAKGRPATVDAGDSFKQAFPPAETRHERVAALLALAAEHGLAGGQSEYRFQPEPALGLARYRVALPLTGPYPAMRAFLADALRGDPALALDSVRLHRTDPNAAQLQAELQFSLLMRVETAAPAPQAALAGMSR